MYSPVYTISLFLVFDYITLLYLIILFYFFIKIKVTVITFVLHNTLLFHMWTLKNLILYNDTINILLISKKIKDL